MDQQTAVTKFLEGAPIMVVEYRSSSTETINYRNKETGRPEKMIKLTHNVEMGNIGFPVSERVPDNFEPDKYVSPLKKGQRCVLHFDRFYRDKGAWNVSGTLEAFSSNGEKK